jgi:hypothetical protein
LKKNYFLYYFKNYEGILNSHIHRLLHGDGQLNRVDLNEGEQDGYEHVKRKSDFLLSLYGLPYTLVNKREVD